MFLEALKVFEFLFQSPLVLRGVRWMERADDRVKYSALHAIMYGPFVMAGLGMSDWKLGRLGNLSKWVHPVPPIYYGQLSTFFQDYASGPLFMAYNKGTTVMGSVPMDGTDQSGLSTFRVADPVGSYPQRIGQENRLVSLELFNEPGSFLKHNGEGNLISAGPPGCVKSLAVSDIVRKPKKAAMFLDKTLDDCPTDDSVFFFRDGLTGESGTVSFEAASKPGCFLSSSSSETSVPDGVFLRCKMSENDVTFNAKSTFGVTKGVAAYHPLSFIAEEKNRNFLLAPLYSLRDETYTLYFDLQ